MNNSRVPRAKKSLGQNFLINEDVLKRIVDFIPDKYSDVVVEIGTGTGSLTKHLASRFNRVITIEKDDRLIDWHEEESILPSNCQLIHRDVLEVPLVELSELIGQKEFIVVGNLPYNISSQILIKLCEERQYVPFASFLFQKEVAQRIVAPPGGKDYGVLSVISQYAFNAKIAMNLHPNLFVPRPKVYSSLVLFDRKEPMPEAVNYKFFKRIVKMAFSQRRKKIINSLKPLKIDKDELMLCLKKVGINPQDRAEDIELKKYVLFSNELLKSFNYSSLT